MGGFGPGLLFQGDLAQGYYATEAAQTSVTLPKSLVFTPMHRLYILSTLTESTSLMSKEKVICLITFNKWIKPRRR